MKKLTDAELLNLPDDLVKNLTKLTQYRRYLLEKINNCKVAQERMTPLKKTDRIAYEFQQREKIWHQECLLKKAKELLTI